MDYKYVESIQDIVNNFSDFLKNVYDVETPEEKVPSNTFKKTNKFNKLLHHGISC